MKEYTVYMHTTPNDKRYTGITYRNPKERWNGGSGYSGNKDFYAAIREFGWGSIEHEILYTGLTENKAKEIQADLIKKFDTTNPDHGYNRAHSDGTLTIAARDRINRILRDKAPGKKSCRCIETGQEFQSIGDAARAFNVDRSMVSNSCNFNAKVHKQYTFEFI